LQPVDQIDGFRDGDGGEMRIVVQVAELSDTESVPRLGQPGQENFDRNNSGAVGLEKSPVAHDAQGTGGRNCRARLQELPARPGK